MNKNFAASVVHFTYLPSSCVAQRLQ